MRDIFPMHLAVTALESAQDIRFIGLVRDISREEKDREYIEHLALHDALTGLPNRSNFTHQISACIQIGKPFTLLFIDIDGFKPINDNFGHDVGDQVLVAIAQRMRGTVASGDFIARLGGDEFVVLLKEVDSSSAVEQVGLRILEKIGAPMNCSGNKCDVGASIGAALYPSNGLREDEILNAADNAMYQAKRSGKNRIIMAG